MELNRQKIVDAFSKLNSKNRNLDPITQAERLVDRLEFLLEDATEGSDIRPFTITDGGESQERISPRRESRDTARQGGRDGREGRDGRDSRDGRGGRDENPVPIRERQELFAPPVPSGSLVTEFDEAEYQDAVAAADPRLRGPEPKTKPQSQSRASRVSNLGQAPALAAGIQYWTVEELVKALNDGTPDDFLFVPNGCPESTKVLAKRNVQPIIMTQGPSIVRLEYTNPGVSSDRSTTDSNGQLDEVVLGLVASKTFTMDMPDLNIEAAMDEIEMQLKGLFSPRTSQSEPVGRDPGPIEQMFNMHDPKRRTPMGESYEIHGTPGWRNASPDSVRDGVISTNRRYGNR